MATTLRNLKINELSFVDSGANQFAKVTIFKRNDLNPLLPRNPLRSYAPDAEVVEKRRHAVPVSAAEERRLADLVEGYRRKPSRTRKSFEEAVADLQKTGGCSRCAAMMKARQQFPELYEAFQKGEAGASETTDALKAAEQGFEARVRQIQQRDGCSRLRAYTKAAREFPNERAAYARGE